MFQVGWNFLWSEFWFYIKYESQKSNVMFKKILAGFGGAIALNIIHEVIRKNFNNVPHINEVGGKKW